MKWLSVFLLLAVGCAHSEATPDEGSARLSASASPSAGKSPSRPISQLQTETLTLVTDPSLVCMVNNQFMGKPQIPVTVAGRTYFGCCEMCRGRLENDAKARSATDPVSGHLVDKAASVIGRTASGETLYFENQDTFRRYSSRSVAN